MSLATRCPKCNTLFKVSAGQLQLHEGQVRCGQCKTVFSGIEHLAAADSTVWANLDLNAETDSQAQPTASEQAEALPLAFSTPHESAAARFSRLPRWAKFALPSLLLALALQLALAFRVNLLQQWPLPDSLIANAPGWLQRWTELPSTQALLIEGSGMNKGTGDEIVLELTLRNQQHLAAKWPHLRIVLVDSNEQVLAVRTLKPSDYQLRTKAISPNQPFPPGATVELTAFLNLHKLKQQLPERETAGFKLELLDNSPDFI